jgi:hypothetical protein
MAALMCTYACISAVSSLTDILVQTLQLSCLSSYMYPTHGAPVHQVEVEHGGAHSGHGGRVCLFCRPLSLNTLTGAMRLFFDFILIFRRIETAL